MKKSVLVLSAMVIASLISSAQATLLWSDDFSGYGTTQVTLDSTAPWSNSNGRFFVGATAYNGRAYYYNNVSGSSTMGIAIADGVQSHHIDGVAQSDYTVTVEGTSKTGYKDDWYVLGRVSGSDSIKLGATIRDTGANLYLNLLDSAGYASGSILIGTYDAASPVVISLTMNGSAVTGTVTNGTNSQTVSYTTTVINAGNPGIGGIYQYGYAIGYYDNFKVDSVPEPATIGLLGIGLAGFLTRKK